MKRTFCLNTAKDRATTRALLPLIALGGGLAATPASALELGELTVQSNLGQPLRASIAYALAPNEMLSNVCVSVGGGRSTGGLPGIGRSTVSITDKAILISGETAVREPMLGTRVTISCPYTPNLSREYMLFVDPGVLADTSAAIVAPVEMPATAPVSQRISTAPVDKTPIGQSTRHQVLVGETLSDIVSRIENRSVKLWPAVNIIFATNPDAFIDNDPNKLKAGSWLTIPSLDGSAPVVAAAPTATPTASTSAAQTPAVETPVVDGSVYEPPILDDINETLLEDTVATDTGNDLRPGDIVPLSDNPFVEPASTVVIPDTELEGPVTSSESPNVPTAIISTGPRSESTSIFAWLVGGGLAIIALLVLFGRRVRNRFGDAPLGFEAAASPSFEQDTTDYDIEDDSPTEENLTLDADLVLGTGLEDGTDMDIAQDFGFAAPTEVDVELPFEPLPADSETDIIPMAHSSMDSILESEILPEDDYDMSVIVDATKMPGHEDVTERDLQAVEIGMDDVAVTGEQYTIDNEVDYDILEQDYQDELTATQALNKELAKAAAELSEDLEDTINEDSTAEMPLATVTEIDATAQLPVQDDDTIETASRIDPNETAAVTISMVPDDKTAEIPVANDDETAEMEISGGKSG